MLLRDLDSMVRQLLSRERDVDTSQAIRSAVLELDRIQVAMETVRKYMSTYYTYIVLHHYIIITSQLTRRTFFEADLLDQQKEEEERKLQQAEEREREREKEREVGKKVPSTARVSPLVQRAMQGKKLKGYL